MCIQALKLRPDKSLNREVCRWASSKLAGTVAAHQGAEEAWGALLRTKLWQANNSWLLHAVSHLVEDDKTLGKQGEGQDVKQTRSNVKLT